MHPEIGHVATLSRLTELAVERVKVDAEIRVVAQQLATGGVSWGAIGRALGMSRQGARQRFGSQ
jgi:hypothetical protein